MKTQKLSDLIGRLMPPEKKTTDKKPRLATYAEAKQQAKRKK